VAIRLDNLELTDAVVGAALPVEPSAHVRLSVHVPGKAGWSTEVDTPAGGATVTVHVPILADAPSDAAATPPPSDAAATPPPAEAPHPNPPGPLWTAGLVVAGVGAIGLGVGVGAGIDAKLLLNSSNSSGCHGNVCSPSAAATRNAALTAATVSTAAFIAGGVLAAGGLSMILVGQRRRGPAVATTVLATPNGVTFSLQGGF
jgi:hypothetical protein